MAIDWNAVFAQAKIDRGLLISKVGPPNGAACDHKESVWEFHQRTIRQLMQKHGFVIRYETKNVVSLGPRAS